MTIIRAPRPQSNFYLLDKGISEDGRLSWAARGLLIFLLGKPDNWKVSIEHLRKQTAKARIQTGRDGIYSLLYELQVAGYITSMQSRDQSGKLGARDYIVSETPYPSRPDMGAPRPQEPDPAQPDTAETTVTRIEKELTIQSKQTHQQHVQPSAAQSRFLEFWGIYPNKKGKQEAEKAWRKRKLDERCNELIAHVRMMVANDDGWRRGFIPMGSTYLTKARWEDEPTTVVVHSSRPSAVDRVMANIQAAQELDRTEHSFIEGECRHPHPRFPRKGGDL